MLKTNIIKGIFLYCILAIGCFGVQTEEKTEEILSPTADETSRSGWFFGAGSGMGLEPLKVVWFNQDKVDNRAFSTFLLQAKVGGYHYFNRWIGMRYYYNFDFSFNPGEKEYSTFFAPVINYVEEGGYTIFQTHTLNFDLILNAFTNEKLDFGFIVGVGAGLVDGVYSMSFRSTYFPGRGILYSNFEARANVGMRFLFQKKYGIEFLSKIPLQSFTLLSQAGAKHNANQNRGGRLFYKGSYHFTLDFVMEL